MPSTAEAPPKTTKAEKVDTSDFIDQATFDQILEMDDEGTDDFSRAIVDGFLEQAEQTFGEMDRLMKEKNLEQLSSRGHFLKGSSATLGLIKVKDYCEQIQHYGSKKDVTGIRDVDDPEVCLENIRTALKEMKKEYERARSHFKVLYPDDPAEAGPGS